MIPTQASPARQLRRLRVAALMLTAALPLAAEGQQEPSAPPTQAPAAVDSQDLGTLSIPDPLLLDQDGQPLHFYSDLVQGRVVAINFIFTTCTTICPPMGANFSKLQKLLGDRPEASPSGREPVLISVTVDPAVDTPQRLKAWAAKFGHQEGWTLVTGPKTEVDRLIKALQVFTADKKDHSPILLLGDDATGQWTRTYGLAPAARLADLIGDLLAAPASAPRP